MRKLKMHIALSLDGYAAAADGGFDWITYNAALEARSHALTADADTVVFGRVTYQGMQSYWPTVPDNPQSSPAEVRHARWLDRVTKVVVSRTLRQEETTWAGTLVLGDDFAARLDALKRQPGGDMVSFGSPSLVNACLAAGVVDELYVNLIPVILGVGQLLFRPQARKPLHLVEAAPMPGGVAALLYRPA